MGWCQYGPGEELPRAFGNESTHGTESMFVKAGFKRVGPFASTRYSSHGLMRRTV